MAWVRLGSNLKDLRSLNLVVKAISETKIARKYALVIVSEDYELSCCGLLRVCGDVAELFRKSLVLKVKAIFLDPNGWLVVPDVNGGQSSTFSLVAVYDPTGA